MHDFHDALPGFSPEQILFDGCAECEERGRDVAYAISRLDPANFQRAWIRARTYYDLTNVSNAERNLLRTLCAVQGQFSNVALTLFSWKSPDVSGRP